MDVRVEDYVRRTRNPIWERELARNLRCMSEDARLRFIQEWMLHRHGLALLFAHKCLQRADSFYWILEFGLDHANASSIEAYLACAVPRLGFRRSVAYLAKQLPLKPKAVGKALYWLPRFVRQGNDRDLKRLRDILDSAKAYPNAQRKPIIVEDPNKRGRVFFLPVPD